MRLKSKWMLLGIWGLSFAVTGYAVPGQQTAEDGNQSAAKNVIYAQNEAPMPERSAQTDSESAAANKAAAEPAAKKRELIDPAAETGVHVEPAAEKKAPKMDPAMKAYFDLTVKIMQARDEEKFGSAVGYCEQLLSSEPKDLPSDIKYSMQTQCAFMYGENKQYDKQLEAFERLERSGAPEEVTGSFCLLKSMCLTRLSRYEEARDLLEGCTGSGGPLAASAMGNLAELYMTMGDVGRSIDAYRRALEKAPKNEHALYGLAAALARNGRWSEAYAQFLTGVRRDPGFNFLKNAFFVPDAEPDFQRGFIFLSLGRYDDAEFYFDRYVSAESREAYKASGESVLAQIRAHRAAVSDNPPVRRYPVLLEEVRSVAVDSTGRYLAFAVVRRTGIEDSGGEVWILDTETDKTECAIREKGTFMFDMAFIGDSTKLRVLGVTSRYEVDAADVSKGYYIYGNNMDVLAISLMPSGGEVVSVVPDGRLALSPWQDPWNMTGYAAVPEDTKRVSVLGSPASIFLTRRSSSEIVTLGDGALKGSLPMQFDVGSVSPHPEKNLFAVGIQSGALLVDDTGQIRGYAGTPALRKVSTLAFDPHGRWLAVMSGGVVEIWRVDAILDPWLPGAATSEVKSAGSAVQPPKTGGIASEPAA